MMVSVTNGKASVRTMVRLLEDQSGYSLVEVMVSILILTAAIIPMVGMFDMGLNAATRGSDYDKARTLANQQLEQAKSLSYNAVRTDFPNSSCTPNSSSAEKTCSNLTSDHFTYSVTKRFIDPQLSNSSTNVGMMKITVTVRWGGTGACNTGNTKCYTTTGVVGR